MSHRHARLGYLAAGLAAVLTLTGAAAVQAQAPSGASRSASSALGATAVGEHPARFGYGPGQRLVAKATYRDANGSTVRFDRTYRGLPVVGGDFVVHLDPSGHYRYGEGRPVRGLPVTTTATISRATAIAAVRADLTYRSTTTSARLVVFGTAHGSPLAWAVTTGDRTGRHGDVTYVSAGSGRAIASRPTVLNDTGVGHSLYVGDVSIETTKKRSAYVMNDKTRGKEKIYDAHNQEINYGTLFKDSDNIWGNGTTSDRATAAVDADFGLAQTWDFYLNTYGRRGIADNGVAANAYVHVYSNWVNASWSDSCFCMRFGDGSSSSGIDPLVSLDVSGHEMTHGVTSRTARLVYSGESGGLNESTSDVFGTSVEWYANNAYDVPDYVIGEEIFRNYNPASNYIRRMDKPSLDGASADCWYSGVGNLDVHYSSGVGNHLFYLLSEGSGAKTINGIAYDSPTCNSSTVTGIGHVAAAAIWYRALTQHWTSNTNYHSARTGMLSAAAELYGSGSAEYNATNAAWAAVNVS